MLPTTHTHAVSRGHVRSRDKAPLFQTGWYNRDWEGKLDFCSRPVVTSLQGLLFHGGWQGKLDFTPIWKWQGDAPQLPPAQCQKKVLKHMTKPSSQDIKDPTENHSSYEEPEKSLLQWEKTTNGCQCGHDTDAGTIKDFKAAIIQNALMRNYAHAQNTWKIQNLSKEKI